MHAGLASSACRPRRRRRAAAMERSTCSSWRRTTARGSWGLSTTPATSASVSPRWRRTRISYKRCRLAGCSPVSRAGALRGHQQPEVVAGMWCRRSFAGWRRGAVGDRRESAGAPSLSGVPDPELTERPRRRRFTAEYKLGVLREAKACTHKGEIGAMLRREGLYTSHLTAWRKQRDAGALVGLAPRKRGPRGPSAEEVEDILQPNPACDKRGYVKRSDAQPPIVQRAPCCANPPGAPHVRQEIASLLRTIAATAIANDLPVYTCNPATSEVSKSSTSSPCQHPTPDNRGPITPAPRY